MLAITHSAATALHLAARRALAGMAADVDVVLLDGNVDYVGAPYAVQTVVRGDQVSLAMAAASCLAKVARDQAMVDLAAVYPGYGFERHVGYPTPAHRAALAMLGPCLAHRRSFGRRPR